MTQPNFRWIASALALVACPLNAEEVAAWLPRNLDDLEKIYQDFHAQPELSFHEQATSKRLAGLLEQSGFVVSRRVGGHGVVAVLKNGEGPTVMVRTDLDGLPVVEETGLPYASRVTTEDDSGVEVGTMHACGHDIHMANVVGVARYLGANRGRWKGTLVCIGQPAEERGAGAKAMLEDGLFERFPRPDYALALHVDPALPSGQVGYRSGYALANVDSVDIAMRGRGGHGAYPHTTVDPVVQAAQLVLDLQTIVSREIAPIAPAVITVGAIHGGTKHNIIASECRLQLTVRSYAADVRQHLLEAIGRKARAVAASARAPEPVVEISEGTPALYNDPELVERLTPVFREALGAEHVHESEPQMGGEDFSRYGLAGARIFMFRLGSVSAARLEGYRQSGTPPPSLHSARYYPDARETLATGVVTMSTAVLELMQK